MCKKQRRKLNCQNKRQNFWDGILGGHSLALVLLGRMLVKYHQRDIRRIDRLPDLFAEEKEGGHALRVMKWYDDYWPENSPERIFLSLIGLFDRPMGDPERKVLLEKAEFTKPLAALAEDEFHELERNLEGLGLLLPEAVLRTEWDCHPLVRKYFGDNAKYSRPDTFKKLNLILFEYYQSIPDSHYPATIVELEPLYHSVIHGVLAEKALDAWTSVFLDRIDRNESGFSVNSMGAYSYNLYAINAFFSKNWEFVDKNINDVQRGKLLASISFCFMASGRLQEAKETRELRIEIALRLGDYSNASTSSGLLSDICKFLGELDIAKSVSYNTIKYANITKNFSHIVKAYSRLANIMHLTGNFKNALDYFSMAEKVQNNNENISYLYSYWGYLHCSFLLDSRHLIDILHRSELAMEIARRENWLLHISLYNLIIYRVSRQSKMSTLSTCHLQHLLSQSVDFGRKANTINELPQPLLYFSDFLRKEKNYKYAYNTLNEANEIIHRSHMKLFATDAALLSGHLALDCKENPPQEMDDELSLGPNCPLREDYIGRALAHHKRAQRLIESTSYHLRDPELNLLAARIAYYQKKDPFPALDKSRKRMEDMGYLGLLPEWEQVAVECNVSY